MRSKRKRTRDAEKLIYSQFGNNNNINRNNLTNLKSKSSENISLYQSSSKSDYMINSTSCTKHLMYLINTKWSTIFNQYKVSTMFINKKTEKNLNFTFYPEFIKFKTLI